MVFLLRVVFDVKS